MGRAEIAQDVLFGLAAFLGADDQDLVPAEAGEPADYGAIFRKKPIAVQFREVGESLFEIVKGKRPLWMAGNLNTVPGAKILKNLALCLREFFFDESNLFFKADVDGMGFRVLFQLLELGLQFSNRLLEVELMFHRREFSGFKAGSNGEEAS